ncbi:putative peptidase (DUF1758) domain-containing protein [Phthorimaea operculella]|nr:putative peptidase (DUF1758) domain-containing protein [Phthorimaea operculella]
MPKTAEEEAITVLRQKRGYKKQCLTKLFTSLGSLDLKKLSLEALVVYKEKLQTDYAAYDNINEQLFVAGSHDNSIANVKLPTIAIPVFTEKKALGLENAASASCVPSTSTPVERAQPVQYKKGSSTSACNVVVKTAPTCSFCKSPSHKLFSCDKFKALPSNERVRFAEENKLCRTCLTAHTNKCKFFFKCGTCRGQHNTLMHEEQTEQPSVAMVTESVGQEMLLPTVQVKLRAADGSEVIARGVLDSCSQNSFITADLVKQLGLQPKAISASVVGIGNVAQKIHQGVDLEVQSVVTSYKRSIHCYVTENITSQLPHNKIDLRSIKVPSHLADTTFDTPGNVQILMAADVFFQALVLQPGESDYVSPNTPVKPEDQSAHPDLYFINTRFGVIVAGTPPNLCHYRQAQKQLALFCQTCNNDINDTIQGFWKAETVPEIFPEKSTEHEQAEQIFKETVKLENNKFQVSLPLKVLEYTGNSTWSYVKTSDNPADCLSRGVQPNELEQNTLWWQGLSYLCDSEYSPSDANIDLSQDLPELKTVAADLPLSCAIVCTEESDDCFDLEFLNKFSSITKMQRVLAYVRRFCKNLIPLASVITLLVPS